MAYDGLKVLLIKEWQWFKENVNPEENENVDSKENENVNPEENENDK